MNARYALKNYNVCNYLDIAYFTPTGNMVGCYCEKYKKSLPNEGSAMIYCCTYSIAGNCWFDIRGEGSQPITTPTPSQKSSTPPQKSKLDKLIERKDCTKTEESFRDIAKEFRQHAKELDRTGSSICIKLAEECENSADKIAEQSRKWKEAGLCGDCGSEIGSRIYSTKRNNETIIYRKCIKDGCKYGKKLTQDEIKLFEKQRRKKQRKNIIVTVILLAAVYGLFSGWFDFRYGKQEYSEGLAAIKKGIYIRYKWGFIDESGTEVIPYIYSWVSNFSEGLVQVKKKGKYGFIDKNGREVVPCKYDNTRKFSEGMAPVGIKKGKRYIWGFVDTNGTEIVPCKYDIDIGIAYWKGYFSEGLAPVGTFTEYTRDSRWGFIDKNGKEVIPLKYSYVKPFSNGLAIVHRVHEGREDRNTCGLIDNRGKEIAQCKYGNIYDIGRNSGFEGELARVYIYDSRGVAGYIYGIMNRHGKEVIPCNQKSIEIEGDIFKVVTLEGETQFFDKSGRSVNRR